MYRGNKRQPQIILLLRGFLGVDFSIGPNMFGSHTYRRLLVWEKCTMMFRSIRASAALVAALAVVVLQCSAQETRSFWQGPAPGVQGKWETATNWQNSFAPRSGFGAYIGNGAVGDPKVDGSALIDNDTGLAQTGTLIIGAGTITGNGSEDHGTLTMNGGTLTVDATQRLASVDRSLVVGGEGASGGGGSGTFLMNVAVLNLTSDK